MAVAGAPADQGVSDRLEHGDVVAVGAVDRPAHRYAVTLGGDRPLPAELGPIRWIGAGSLAPIGRLVQRAMQGDIVEDEADDPVEGGKCLGLELLEYACMDPFITSRAQVVSDTWWSRIASTSTHDAPVNRRIMIPLKHSRSNRHRSRALMTGRGDHSALVRPAGRSRAGRRRPPPPGVP